MTNAGLADLHKIKLVKAHTLVKLEINPGHTATVVLVAMFDDSMSGRQ